MSDFFKQKEFELKCSSLRKNILNKNKKIRKDKDEFDSTFHLLLKSLRQHNQKL